MALDSESVRAFPSQARLVSLGNVVRNFLGDPAPRVRKWQTVLGHLASLEKLVPRGRLRMRSLQFQLKESWSASGDPNARIPWTNQITEDLAWWTDPSNLAQGVPLSSPPPEVLLYTDASKEGWGAHYQDLTASGIWSKDEKSCLLYTSPSPRDGLLSRMPSSA